MRKTPLPIGSPLKGTMVSANNSPFEGGARRAGDVENLNNASN